MIIDNDPPITRHISVPRDMSQLSCSALTAGIVEAVLDGLEFVSALIFAPRDLDRESTICSPQAGTRYGPLGTDRSVSATHYHPYQARQIRHGARRSPQIIPIRTQYSIQSSPAMSSLSSSLQLLLLPIGSTQPFCPCPQYSHTSKITRPPHLARVGRSTGANCPPIQLPT